MIKQTKLTATFSGKKVLGIVVAAFAVVTLQGCAAMKVGKRSPDEFSVVTSAPLIIPPDFGLRPPEPSVVRERELAKEEETEQAIYGQNLLDDQREASEGEIALLRQMGALSVDDNIRDQIRRDNVQLVKVGQKSTLEKMKWWTNDHESEWSNMLGRGQGPQGINQQDDGYGSARPDR